MHPTLESYNKLMKVRHKMVVAALDQAEEHFKAIQDLSRFGSELFYTTRRAEQAEAECERLRCQLKRRTARMRQMVVRKARLLL